MRKVFFSLTVILSLSFFWVSPSLADTSVSGQVPNSINYKAPQQADFIGLNLAHAGTCWIIGQDPTTGSLCDAVTPSGVQLYTKLPDGGALGSANLALLSMYKNPPVSTDIYLARVSSSLGFTSAYAATPTTPASVGGSGSAVLVFVLNLWETARNITYLLFILIFVIVGLMVMFRHRINPQTVVTIQMALPRLVIGLVLVTFSYLIASLLVDLSFVGAGFLGLFFSTAFPNTFLGNSAFLNVSTAGNVPGIFSLFFIRTSIVGNTIWGFAQLFSGFFPTFTTPPTGTNVIGWLGLGGLNLVGGLVNLVTGFIGGAIGIIIVLIVVVAALIQCLRLVWGLLQCYISILVFTILGPFIILVASLPGQEKLLGFWWRNILGNVLAFPAVFGAFLFASVILDNTSISTGATASLPLFGGIDTSLLRSMLALGIVLGTPAIPRMTRDLVGARGIGAIAQMAGSGVGAATTVAGLAAIPVGTGLWRRATGPRPGSPGAS